MTKTKKILISLIVIPIIYLLFGFLIAPIILKNQIVKNLDEKLTLKSEIGKIYLNGYRPTKGFFFQQYLKIA